MSHWSGLAPRYRRRPAEIGGTETVTVPDDRAREVTHLLIKWHEGQGAALAS